MNCLQFTTKYNFYLFTFFTSVNFNHFSVWPNVAWNWHCTNRIRNLHSGILADWPNHWHTHHHTCVADLHCVYTVFWGELAVKCNGRFTPWTVLRARGCISSLVSIDFTQSKQMDEELKCKERKTVLGRWWQRQPTSGNWWCSCAHCSANADCCKEGGLWTSRCVELWNYNSWIESFENIAIPEMVFHQQKTKTGRTELSTSHLATIDVTYLLEEGAGRRLRRRALGFSDFVGRK